MFLVLLLFGIAVPIAKKVFARLETLLATSKQRNVAIQQGHELAVGDVLRHTQVSGRSSSFLAATQLGRDVADGVQ